MFKQQNSNILLSCVMLCLLYCVGCSAAFAQFIHLEDVDRIEIDEEQYGWFKRSAQWPGGLETIIPVCWENIDDAPKVKRDAVKKAIDESWARVAALNFVGWGECRPDQRGIYIYVTDDANDGPHTNGLGTMLNGVSKGMVLNLSFQHYEKTLCENRVTRCAQIFAVHEFGHGIGFAHEHLRESIPGECALKNPDQGERGDWELTPYDKKSAMNHCYSSLIRRQWLSDLDIESVQKVYGARL